MPLPVESDRLCHRSLLPDVYLASGISPRGRAVASPPADDVGLPHLPLYGSTAERFGVNHTISSRINSTSMRGKCDNQR